MADWEAFGMPVETDDDDDLVQPLAAAVVVKGFDSKGDIAYWVSTTKDVQSVEAIGMFTFGADTARRDNG